MHLATFIPIAFLCGSVPFGLILAKRRGVDIRKHGSGNIGATNVWRVLGPRVGVPCFVLDVLKGLVPVLAAGLAAGLVGGAAIASRDAWLWMAVVVAAIAGHMFTPFAGFKGGKGVATGLGATLGAWPVLTVPALVALVAWIVAVKLWRMVSVASCLAALVLPAMVLGWGLWRGRTLAELTPFAAVTGAMGLLVIWRHRSNLGRVWAGTERRIGERSAPPAAAENAADSRGV